MLQRLDLETFKCFNRLELPFAPLTLLTGTNASGKSSILQALVLLQQTMREHEWSSHLILNGQSLRLGAVCDVIDKVNGRRDLSIGVVDNCTSIRWKFSGERDHMSMAVEAIDVDGGSPDLDRLRLLLPENCPKGAVSLTHRIRDLTYITAERIGPQDVYQLEDRQIATVVGPKGEHAVSVLHWGGHEKVIDGLRLPGVAPTRLRQVEEWMRRFFPGCAMEIQKIPHANLVSFGLRTSDDTDFHLPVNVGFGLTQLFPIIVAALSSEKAGILLIENPEVHLHPAGQAMVGAFLSEVAAAGIQVILESHSDHVLNGIRRAVKSRVLAARDVVIHYFRQRSDAMAQIHSPAIDQDGRIDAWPDGFFDQFDRDVNFLAGWE